MFRSNQDRRDISKTTLFLLGKGDDITKQKNYDIGNCDIHSYRRFLVASLAGKIMNHKRKVLIKKV